MRIAVLTAGSQERLWLHNLLTQTSHKRGIFELAAPDFPGQPTRLDCTFDLLILTESAAPAHLLSRFLRDLPPAAALLLVTADAGLYRGLLMQRVPSVRGGWGILAPSVTSSQLEAAIGAVLQGLCIVQPASDEPQHLDPLTPREQEIVGLLAEGLSNKQIALRLHLSENTVKTHIAAVYGKAGVNNRAELMLLAARQGWVAL